MKRFSVLCLLILCCSLPAYSQFWISFGWNEPHCQSCLWMEEALRLPPRKAAEYHKIIHTFGQKIEKEARRENRYWDRSARKIYDLRMERDRRIQRLLTPAQFNLYIRFVRERPQRIHDFRGWYNNPHYPNYRPSHDCRHFEEDYWNHRWNNSHYDNHWKDDRRDDRYDRNDRYDRDDHKNNRYDNNGRKPVKPTKPNKPSKPSKDRNDKNDKHYNSGRRAS